MGELSMGALLQLMQYSQEEVQEQAVSVLRNLAYGCPVSGPIYAGGVSAKNYEGQLVHGRPARGPTPC